MVLVGSTALVLSVILPWYSDIDRFKSGYTFLGITGPVYLAGLIILVAAGISLGLIILRVMERPLPKLPLKEPHYHLFTAVISGLMVLMASSVYFHPKFGMNLTDKSVGVGMLMAIFGVIVTGIGAYLTLKTRVPTLDPDAIYSPSIDLDRKAGNVGNVNRSTIEDVVSEVIENNRF